MDGCGQGALALKSEQTETNPTHWSSSDLDFPLAEILAAIASQRIIPSLSRFFCSSSFRSCSNTSLSASVFETGVSYTSYTPKARERKSEVDLTGEGRATSPRV